MNFAENVCVFRVKAGKVTEYGCDGRDSGHVP